CRHAWIDRAAEQAEEVDVDGTVAELGIEPADDEAAWAGELVVDGRAGRDARRGHDDPWARDTHADLEPLALVRLPGRCDADDEGSQCGGEPDGEARHGTLRNHSAESAPPASSSAADPPAKRSVISRDSLRLPSREPSRSYTSRRRASLGAE